jgi:hypothetical protein
MTGGSHSGVQLLRFAFNNTENISPREVILEVSVRATCFQTKFDEKSALNLPCPTRPGPTRPPPPRAPTLRRSRLRQGVQEDPPLPPTRINSSTPPSNATSPPTTSPTPKPPRPSASPRPSPEASGAKSNPAATAQLRRQTGETLRRQLPAPEVTLASKRAASTTSPASWPPSSARPASPPAPSSPGTSQATTKIASSATTKRPTSSRSWIEFCLFDDVNNSYNWVPVDVVRDRKSSSDPRADLSPGSPSAPWTTSTRSSPSRSTSIPHRCRLLRHRVLLGLVRHPQASGSRTPSPLLPRRANLRLRTQRRQKDRRQRQAHPRRKAQNQTRQLTLPLPTRGTPPRASIDAQHPHAHRTLGLPPRPLSHRTLPLFHL